MLHSVLVGKGTKLICIQNSDPFYRHLHKDGGARSGEEAGRISGRREHMQREKRFVYYYLFGPNRNVDHILHYIPSSEA